ncbi:MAG: DUF3109 family protein [Chitinophagales bacterium]
MLVIEDKIVSDDILEEKFVCELSACKGECCVAGDVGAPLEASELAKLEEIYETIKPYLTEAGIAAIKAQGFWVNTDQPEKYNTPLIENKGCAYINYDNGIAICGIERAYRDGKVDFKKPISCHLYPIRVTKQRKTGMQMLNYERWDVCKAACKNGKKLGVPVYQFLREPIIRAWGEEFYSVLEQYAAQQKK